MPIFPPRRILVPLDLFPVSLAAWRHARDLGEAFEARLDAVFVKEIPPSTEIPLTYLGLGAAEKRALLRDIRSQVGPGPRILFEEGDPAAMILRLAKSGRYGLIVMGTSGRTGLSRAWLGSVTESVVRRSPVPVWVAGGKPRAIRSILAPLNFEPHSEAGLLAACELGAALKAKVTALHVAADPARLPNPRLRLSIMTGRLPKGLAEACGLELEVRQGAALTEKIVREGRRHDVIVLAAHRKSLLGDLVLGTTAERVLRVSKVPVLTVPAGSAAVLRRPARAPSKRPQLPY